MKREKGRKKRDGSSLKVVAVYCCCRCCEESQSPRIWVVNVESGNEREEDRGNGGRTHHNYIRPLRNNHNGEEGNYVHDHVC